MSIFGHLDEMSVGEMSIGELSVGEMSGYPQDHPYPPRWDVRDVPMASNCFIVSLTPPKDTSYVCPIHSDGGCII